MSFICVCVVVLRGFCGTKVIAWQAGGAAWRRGMCVGCAHRHGAVNLVVALVVRERCVVRRSGQLGSRLVVRVHGLGAAG